MRPQTLRSLNAPGGARCSLTDPHGEYEALTLEGLNAPDGAGCSPTTRNNSKKERSMLVSMHLMVLGAPRPLGVSNGR